MDNETVYILGARTEKDLSAKFKGLFNTEEEANKVAVEKGYFDIRLDSVPAKDSEIFIFLFYGIV